MGDELPELQRRQLEVLSGKSSVLATPRREASEVMAKPSIFIGSSTEGLDFARAARALLAFDAEITLWNEGFFTLGNTFIKTLINSLPRFDFAVLVLTPDDLVN